MTEVYRLYVKEPYYLRDCFRIERFNSEAEMNKAKGTLIQYTGRDLKHYRGTQIWTEEEFRAAHIVRAS